MHYAQPHRTSECFDWLTSLLYQCCVLFFFNPQVRIQLRTPPASIFGNLDHMRNELVIRFQVRVSHISQFASSRWLTHTVYITYYILCILPFTLSCCPLRRQYPTRRLAPRPRHPPTTPRSFRSLLLVSSGQSDPATV